jgi:hypothetical protein
MVSAFFLFCGCVEQANVAVVEKWGRFLRLAEPGLHFFNPCAGEFVAGTLSTRVQSLDVRVETKTKVLFFFRFLPGLSPPRTRHRPRLIDHACRRYIRFVIEILEPDAIASAGMLASTSI